MSNNGWLLCCITLSAERTSDKLQVLCAGQTSKFTPCYTAQEGQCMKDCPTHRVDSDPANWQ